MTHEFLHHLHVLSVRHQHGGKAVPKRVPADVLMNPGANSCGAHDASKKDVRPVRVSTSTVRTRKHPVLGCAYALSWSKPRGLKRELGPAAQVFETPRSYNCP